ncbi:SPOR domain-containing protein [Moraxella sp. ZY210820]|uniref:SPOR domain-containing protein n=1 Tax=unclassified Moraxella TaxID=2685852 RepID=UPI00272F6AF2|nr:SPOR domain-containing protein [Moraxella sp. ZY210820]WLF82961.1 SPOR domain-containing protein [Moraxella sp. ZY210820]
MNKKQILGGVLLLGGGILVAILGQSVSKKELSPQAVSPSGIISSSEQNQIPESEQVKPVELQELKADDTTVQQQLNEQNMARVQQQADEFARQQQAIQQQQQAEQLQTRQTEVEAQQKQVYEEITPEQDAAIQRQALAEQRRAEQTEIKRQQAQEAKRKAEQEQAKQRQAEQERKREQEQVKRNTEQEERKRLQQEEARKRKAEQERKREQEQAKRKAEADKKKSNTDKRQWMVQISLAKDTASANKQIAQLRANGYRVTTSPTSKGLRIMVGPHKDKASAEATRQKIISNANLNMKSAWVHGWVPLKDR